jgi:hypothetical protein
VLVVEVIRFNGFNQLDRLYFKKRVDVLPHLVSFTSVCEMKEPLIPVFGMVQEDTLGDGDLGGRVGITIGVHIDGRDRNTKKKERQQGRTYTRGI